MLPFVIVLILFLTVPFPIAAEPETISAKAIYEGFDTDVGIVATRDGVIGTVPNSILLVDEKGSVKKSLTSHPSKLKFLVRDDDVGLAVFASGSALTLFEMRKNAGDFSLAVRCEAKTSSDFTSSTKTVSGGLVGFKTRSGGMVLDVRGCKFKKFDGDFVLGLPLDSGSGVPFVHDGSAYLARAKQGEIEVVKIDVDKRPCDKPVSKSGYVAVPVDGGLNIALPSSGSVKNVAQSVCGRSSEILMSTEPDALFLPGDKGYALYNLSAASKRWEHPVPGTVKLLGLFGNDMFWAFGFERDGRNYVNLFRFNHKSAQLYGRCPLESSASGRFAWSDKGAVALELDGRIVVYQSSELVPRFSVRLSAPLSEIVSHNGTFYALDNSGRLLVIPPRR